MLLAPRILLTLTITASIFGCGLGSGANSANNTPKAIQAPAANSNSIKDDTDELETLVKLPFHPEESAWRDDQLGEKSPGQAYRKLIAVLRFSKADALKVAALTEKGGTGTSEVINIEPWFPAELVAQSQTSGDETIKGTSFPATEFLNPPFTGGKITRVEGTDYFVLELFAK